MACKDTNICNEIVNSTCVEYRGKLNNDTTIISKCVDQKMVNEDIYDQLQLFYDDLDISELGELSITFPLGASFKDIIKQYEIEIDALKTRVTALENIDYCNVDITSCGISFGTLVDPCGDSITTLGQLLQTLVAQHNT